MSKLDPDWPVFEFKPYEEEEDTSYLAVYEGEDRTDRDGRKYEYVGHFLENDAFYQGLNMITIIKRKSDGKLFGYSWWDDISKNGDSYIESNGDEYFDQDWVNEESWIDRYVFTPVEEYPIKAFKHKAQG